MRRFSAAAVALSFALFVVYSTFTAKTKAQTSAVDAGRKPVVVELFTSEGCSSCPPADALLQDRKSVV